MQSRSIILLPGMDGTGKLFAPFIAESPAEFGCSVIRYPTDAMLSYDELFELIEQQIPSDRPFILLAESFSGPLAVRYAAKYPHRVSALVLCATFVRFPVPGVLIAYSKLFASLRPADWMLRLMLAGSDAPQALIDSLQQAMTQVPPRVLAHRLAQVAAVDVRDYLAKCTMPVLYLQAAQDRIVRAARLQEMTVCSPQMTVTQIRAPHLLLQRAPAEAWKAILSFLERKSG